MFAKIVKLVFKAFGIELLIKELMQIVYKELAILKEEFNKKLAKLLLKFIVVTVIVTFFFFSLLFGLIALGFYLNELFYSTYKGFLIIASSFFIIGALCVIFAKLFQRPKNRE
jgi:energy-coupling factor transporter transmembrane protein EcfT